MAWFAIAATVAAGAAQAVQTRNAGIIQSQQYQQAATAEGDAARGREIERRRILIKTLAARDAYAGATGQTTGGSIATLNMRDINDASNDLLYDKGSVAAKQRAYTSGASNARSAGNIGAFGALMQTGMKAATLS
jgi:hypothetical protein